MTDTRDPHKDAERQAKPPLPNGEKSFDPWEEEFRRTYKDDNAFDF